MTVERARRVHVVVAGVAWFALVLQFVLVLQGSRVLVEDDAPGLGERIYQFFAYFTIQSNILVAVVSTLLARDPARDGLGFRVARVGALVGITVTGLVHFFLLRPLLDLDGLDWLCDKLLHMASPLLAVVAWAAVGPRPRIGWREVSYALCWPIVWVIWTLVYGQLAGWVPYPFLDADENGWASVLVVCLGITVLFVALFALFRWLDGRLRATPL